MRKVVALTLICILCLCGCSAETEEGKKVNKIIDGIVDVGKDASELVIDVVNKHVNTDGMTQEQIETFESSIDTFSKYAYCTGKDIKGICSGIQNTDLTILIKYFDQEDADILGKLVTSDNAQYVAELNDANYDEENHIYSVDAVGLYGIIPGYLNQYTNRSIEVSRYNEFTGTLGSKAIKKVSAISDDSNFETYLLTEGDDLCGFLFVERDGDE